MDVVQIPQNLGVMASAFWAWAIDFLPRLGGAILILIVGYIVAGWAGRTVARLANRVDRLDPTLRPVFSAIVRYSILIMVVVAALGQLGVQTTSILAALGAAALAIGLALQGTLSNIAAGHDAAVAAARSASATISRPRASPAPSRRSASSTPRSAPGTASSSSCPIRSCGTSR